MKKRCISYLLLPLSIVCISTSSQAIEVHGNLVQGGFVFGQTTPYAKVSIEGESTQSGADGTFTFGLNRNLPEAVTLEITTKDKTEKQVLFIKQRTYKTQKINGIPSRKVTPNAEDMKHIQSDSAQIKDARNHFSDLKFIFEKPILPASGPKSGVYGSRRVFNGEERSWHKGMDIAAPTGANVVAPIGGVVRLALPLSFFNGNLIILDHGYNLMTIYAHLNSMNVKTGETVQKGDIIGTVGQTGRATGPHLHWGLYWKNMALDPELWVQGN